MMKVLIVYISVHHGNTEKVASVVARTLDADLVQVKQADASMLEQYDVIGFGSGIYYGKHHENLLGFVDRLPVVGNKKAFIFSTSGLRKMPLVHDFNKSLKEGLRQKGFDVIGEFSCRGYDTSRSAMILGGISRGRPNAKDLRRAEDFTRHIKNSL